MASDELLIVLCVNQLFSVFIGLYFHLMKNILLLISLIIAKLVYCTILQVVRHTNTNFEIYRLHKLKV